jgi:UDP-N-acetylmuramoylalanine--D-glutamate ligase
VVDQGNDKPIDLRGIHVLVVGLAREGTALTRFLAERGACVTVTDVRPAEALAVNLASLDGLSVEFALGGHPLTILDDRAIAFVSPGIPLEIPFLAEARRRGLALSSETRLFACLCPALVIGITGSSGKSTTTALVGDMLQAAGHRTWVGGNIGRPLIGHLGEISPADRVVMELSSFQLEFFAPGPPGKIGTPTASPLRDLFDSQGWSPAIAAVLNVTPNHLDRHTTMEAYARAKQQIMAYQHPGDAAILNRDDPVTQQWGQAASRGQRVLWFSLEQEVDEGAFLKSDDLMLRMDGREWLLCRRQELQLLGQHNVANVLAAATLAALAGAPPEAIRRVANTFTGIGHRLELVRVHKGVRWYNDSIATSPERTIAALRAFPEEHIILLAGGRDKQLPWEAMADLAWKRSQHVILFGEAATLIDAALRHSRHATLDVERVHHAGTMGRAVELAAHLARPGDVVLLSPGGTSFDAYRDFEARGEHFRQLVQELE